MTSLDLAERLLARGLSVYPVPRPGHGFDGKTPAVSWKTFQTRLPTLDELTAWFQVPQNIAVVTGAVSGVVVIDCDGGDALAWALKQLPDTPWQTRTAKGVHLYYQHPDVSVATRTRLHTDAGTLAIDVRGDGASVIAPGSLHASGVWYRAVGNWRIPRESLPMFSPKWLPPAVDATTERVTKKYSQPHPVSRTGIDPLRRARAYLRVVPPPDIGHGSDAATFFTACRLVRSFNLTTIDANALLWEWCGNRPGWDRDWIAKKVENACEYGNDQFGAWL